MLSDDVDLSSTGMILLLFDWLFRGQRSRCVGLDGFKEFVRGEMPSAAGQPEDCAAEVHQALFVKRWTVDSARHRH